MNSFCPYCEEPHLNFSGDDEEVEMWIEKTHRGEIVCALVNMSTEPYTVEPFERIGQLIFLAHYSVAFEEVERLPQTSRGADGFGSSGRF